MKLCSKGNLAWLEFELLRGLKGIKHAFVLRSRAMNEAFIVDASCEGKDQGASRLAHSHIRLKALVGARVLAERRQVHGVNIQVVSKSKIGTDRHADGLMTDQVGVGIMTKCADCQCTLFYDPTRRVIANVHAGWRGSVGGIYAKTVEMLRRRYGCRPQDLLVGIGPSLGPSHAEFIHYRQELPQSFWRHQRAPNHFDFWTISHEQLQECGIMPHHIEIAGMCTYQQAELCFSYRREKTAARHRMLIALH